MFPITMVLCNTSLKEAMLVLLFHWVFFLSNKAETSNEHMEQISALERLRPCIVCAKTTESKIGDQDKVQIRIHSLKTHLKRKWKTARRVQMPFFQCSLVDKTKSRTCCLFRVHCSKGGGCINGSMFNHIFY